MIKNYDTFRLDSLLERVDYEWDLENGIEIDYRNQIKSVLTNSFKKTSNKKEWYKDILNKIKSKKKSVKVLILGILTPILINSTIISDNDIVTITKNIDSELTQDVQDIVKTDSKQILSQSYDVAKLEPSDKLIELIKDEEKLVLTAYELGDQKITIGYGHAEPLGKSKFKLGDTITKQKADKLFRKDLNRTINGVKRIFKRWKKKDIDIKLTQSQFDAMISMAYNMGITGLATTEFIQLVKQNKMDAATEIIKSTKLKKGFSGLIKRRQRESDLFAGVFK